MIGSGKTTFSINLGNLLKDKIDVAAIEAYIEEDNLNESGLGDKFEFNEGTQKLGMQWWKGIVEPELKNILGQQVSLYFIVTFSSNSLL